MKSTETYTTLDRFLNRVPDQKVLTPEEEVELSRRIREGDSDARERLIKANLRFVVSIAKEYQGQGLPLSDLISEGSIGLMKAINRFDETRGFKFVTYAVWWIRQSILQALAEHARMVRLPANRIKRYQKVLKVTDKLEQKLGREPGMDEIADRLDLEVDSVSDAISNAARELYLDQPIYDNDRRILDTLEDTQVERPDFNLNQSSLKMDLESLLGNLKPREAEVLRLVFGIGQERPMTLGEISLRLKVTKERVRQIKEKALERLRHPSRVKVLREYLD